MPQMMPMNWIMLFIFFLVSFMLFNMMNYYLYIIKMNKMTYKLIMKKNNIWKW